MQKRKYVATSPDLGAVTILATTNFFNKFYDKLLQELEIESSAGSYGVFKINLKDQEIVVVNVLILSLLKETGPKHAYRK